MKLAFLGDRSSIHIVRWVNEMAIRGHDVHVITMTETLDPLLDTVNVHVLPFGRPHGYFLNALALRRTLGRIKPDLLHVHCASGYGTLGSLTGLHPRIVSVWGGDVYDFPSKSPLHHWLVSRTLRTADWVCSTSQTMAEHTARSFPEIKRLSVIPFGIDGGRFYPEPSRRHPDILTVGTVKALRPNYGIRYLIEGFGRAREMLRNRSPSLAQKLRLLIVGGGSERAQLESLVGKLGLGSVTTFTGAVPHSQVPEYLNQLDVYVAVSVGESFGVAVLEASACGLPVVVSAVGGLPEVVVDGVTGFVVEKKNALATAEALLRLIEDPCLRQSMGESGRQHVISRYRWAESARLMEDVYRRVGTA